MNRSTYDAKLKTEVQPVTKPVTKTGLITKGVGGEYTVVCDGDIYICTARGVFRNRQVTPFVGDHVTIDTNKCSIEDISPRKNMLRRPPVANIDQVIITMAAAQPAFNAGLLDKLLVIAAHEGIDAVICINKYDLHVGSDAAFLPYILAGYPLVKTSLEQNIKESKNIKESENVKNGIHELKSLMDGKLNVFAGPSGVGKSSLINALIPSADMEIGDISVRLRRGKHTTRHAEILTLGAGYCVDTPGFSSLEAEGIPAEDYAALFPEFLPFIGQCKFSDCIHDRETHCAIKEQVGNAIYLVRYQSYLGFVRKAREGSR